MAILLLGWLLDVTGDKTIALIDALLVVNRLNELFNEAEGESDSDAADDVFAAFGLDEWKF